MVICDPTSKVIKASAANLDPSSANGIRYAQKTVTAAPIIAIDDRYHFLKSGLSAIWVSAGLTIWERPGIGTSRELDFATGVPLFVSVDLLINQPNSAMFPKKGGCSVRMSVILSTTFQNDGSLIVESGELTKFWYSRGQRRSKPIRIMIF
jgi:hypothetical protein